MTIITPETMIVDDQTDHGPLGPSCSLWISEAGGLSQFGAFIEILPPGSSSSIKHWHRSEDEMVYVLEGEVTLIEGNTENTLVAGDAATFRAGVPVGHFLKNNADADARYLVVGTRARQDTITYPDHDRVLYRDRVRKQVRWTDGSGKPASNPYHE
jgi:uncharacterized cupin superfamily protein